MQNILRKTLAILLVAVLLVGALPGVCFVANAATVDYQYGSTSQYSNVSDIIINWGTRGETATFLSPNAETFYNTTSYAYLSTLSGSSALNDVPDSDLYVALNKLMADAHSKKTSYDETRDMFQYTDCQENGANSTKISAFYSGEEVGPAWDGGSTWNREHVWPNSKGSADGSESNNINETDIMMLRPETKGNNSSRGNKAFGESDNYYYPNLTTTYDVRGDVSRILLYCYVRWGTEESVLYTNMWGESGVMESREVLLKWMKEDPVDTWEMGRNDSVQSITGTRNVFVDYPELAFALFNEDIPEMDTPSGNAAAVPYTITARSANEAQGTVSLSGNRIVATPASGYKTSGYRVVSGNATVTQNGNIFTVSASSDCTVEITFTASTMYTVKVVEDNKIVSSQQVQENTKFTLPAFSGALSEGYSFVGWATVTAEPTTEKPTVSDPGANVTVTADTNFYAVVSYRSDEGEGTESTWELVKSSSQLQAGNRVIIAAQDYDYAMSTEQKSNNRGQVAITKSADKSSLTVLTADTTAVFTLETGTISGSFAFKDTNGYLYAVNNSNNYLRTRSTCNDAASFYITANTDGSTSVTSATFVSATSGVGNVPMQYNASGMFACYPKATQKALALYVENTVSGTTYYTTVWTEASCSHTDKTTLEFAPSCTAQGYTEYYCADCGEYLYTDEYVDALGHTEVVTPGYAATLTAAGLTDGIHCSVCKEVLAVQEAIPCLASVDSWGLVLSDDLSVKFKIYVDASISANAKVHISLNSFTTTYETATLTAVGENYYYASVNVAAAQMGDTISVRITNGTDSSVTKTYSVLEYATKMLADADQSKYHALLKEMLNYGAAAQTYFGYKIGSLVNAEITGAGLAAVPASAQQNMTFTGSAEGISYYGASLVYREKLAVRFYFEGSVDGITFENGGAPCSAASKNGMYYVEVGGILPQDLDQSLTLTATDAAGNTFTVTYSPMNYIVRMYNKGNDTQKNLMTALYNYHLAAKALTQA